MAPVATTQHNVVILSLIFLVVSQASIVGLLVGGVFDSDTNGKPGVVGDTGPRGEMGSTGPSGPSGEPNHGTNGVDGATGAAGASHTGTFTTNVTTDGSYYFDTVNAFASQDVNFTRITSPASGATKLEVTGSTTRHLVIEEQTTHGTGVKLHASDGTLQLSGTSTITTVSNMHFYNDLHTEANASAQFVGTSSICFGNSDIEQTTNGHCLRNYFESTGNAVVSGATTNTVPYYYTRVGDSVMVSFISKTYFCTVAAVSIDITLPDEFLIPAANTSLTTTQVGIGSDAGGIFTTMIEYSAVTSTIMIYRSLNKTALWNTGICKPRGFVQVWLSNPTGV